VGIAEKYRGKPPLPNDLQERLRGLPELLARFDIRLAYLFGSALRQEEPADVDLAILPGPRFDFFEFYAALSRFLDSDRIDLVLLDKAPSPLKFHVVSQGKLLHKASAEEENRFEKAVLAQFRDDQALQGRRLELLKARLQ